MQIFGGQMTQSLAIFGQHAVTFTRRCIEGSDDFKKVRAEAGNFIWTAQRVVFAVGVFFAMRATAPYFTLPVACLLANAVYYTAPETSLGMGAYLFYRAGLQFLAASAASSPEILAMYGTVNLISGLIAWKWYDKNLRQDNLINGSFIRVSDYLSPIVANRFTGKTE